MWIAGVGCRMKFHPGYCDEDHPMMFDDDVLAFDGFEREDYDWKCTTCGEKQGDHESSMSGGFKCDFVPVPAKPRRPRPWWKRLRRKIRRAAWELIYG